MKENIKFILKGNLISVIANGVKQSRLRLPRPDLTSGLAMTQRGFTIVELLVSITIIALLSTIGMTGYQAVSRGGRDALRKSDMEQIRSALEIYKSENSSYPPASVACLADLSTDFLPKYPKDPKSPAFEYCYVRTSNLTYELCAHLENGGLADNCGGTNACIGNCSYTVSNP